MLNVRQLNLCLIEFIIMRHNEGRSLLAMIALVWCVAYRCVCVCVCQQLAEAHKSSLTLQLTSSFSSFINISTCHTKFHPSSNPAIIVFINNLAGIPPWYVTKPTKSTQPCIPAGSLNRVPALISWGKCGIVTSAGCQVTLCDPIWHMSSRP